jgi:Xaa-Pro aminopeptidase
VADVVIYADSVRFAEMRHEVPASVPDAFLYVETGGDRHVVLPSLEIPIVSEVGAYVLHPFEEFGLDELRASATSTTELFDSLVVRALRELGVKEALVPPSFPLGTADTVRASGIGLTTDDALFEERRRVKTGAELAGIRRAQGAAEAGMAAARDLLRRAKADAHGALDVDGHPLTVARVKAGISSAFLEHGATADAFVVAHGAQAAIGHHLGHGQLRASETIVVDLWPRDDASSCYADMTRTFVVGDVPAEIAEWHRLCVEALERAAERAAPGVTGKELFATACDVFEAESHVTQRTKVHGETLDHGFYHSLGHGVGLEVHEAPLLGLVGTAPLVAGDVLAIEPGLYRQGLGGVRIEDLVLVREGGAERLTSFPYELEA